MSMDDGNSELAEMQIERERAKVFGGGGGNNGDLTQTIGVRDPRFSALIAWAKAALGTIALLIGIGVYNKLSTISDTLLLATADIKNQGKEIAEVKVELQSQGDDLDQLQRQVYSLEGKAMRGIEEVKRGR